MTIIQAITLAVAVLGAVLGIINTWHQLDQTRVKLKVVPAIAFFGPVDTGMRFSVEVTNLSAFAVTVDDVGFFYHGTRDRAQIVHPFLADRGPWPRRLEPRSSVSVYSEIPSNPGRRIRCAYAKTQCGHTCEGTSPALEQIAARS